jgi:hypothetical protein
LLRIHSELRTAFGLDPPTPSSDGLDDGRPAPARTPRPSLDEITRRLTGTRAAGSRARDGPAGVCNAP